MWIATAYVFLPQLGAPLSRVRSLYYVAGAVLGVVLFALAAVYFFAPDDRRTWLFAVAMQSLALGSVWFSIVPPLPPLIMGVVACAVGMTSALVVHYKIGQMPIPVFLEDLVEVAFALMGSAALFAHPKIDPRTAAVAFALRLLVCALERWMRCEGPPAKVVIMPAAEIERRREVRLNRLSRDLRRIGRSSRVRSKSPVPPA